MTTTSRFLCSMVMCAAAVAGIASTPADPDLRTGVLPNGITYYVRRNPQPANRADFFLSRRIGSVVEEDSERGMAHFLEHMCFNGTDHFPGRSLIGYLESLGVKFGENLNAYTSTDETVYNISRVPVGRREVLDSCLLILDDWSRGLTLSGEEIDVERGVIVNEWRHRNSPSNRMLERAAPRLYAGSRYGQRMPIGLMSVVEGCGHDELRRFYHKWHRPDNQAVIVVGDVNPDSMEMMIRERFSLIPAAPAASEAISYAVPSNDSLIVAVESDKEQEVTVLQLHLKHAPAEGSSAEALWRSELIGSLATSMLADRFEEAERDPDCAWHHLGIGDGKFLLSRPASSLVLRGVAREGRAPEALALWRREIRRAAEGGFLPSEMAFALRQARASMADKRAAASRTSSTDYARRLSRHFIYGRRWLPQSVADELGHKIALLDSITLDEVNGWMRSVASTSGRDAVVLAYHPADSDDALTEKSLRQAFAAGGEMAYEPYVDHSVTSDILEHEPERGSVVGRDSLSQLGVELLTLSNGVRVYLKRTDGKEGQVYVRGLGRGGFSACYDQDLVPSMKMLDDALEVSATGRFSAADLRRLLTGRDLKVTATVGNMDETVEIAASADNLADAFRLMYLKLTDTRADSLAYRAMAASMADKLSRQSGNPVQIMGDSIHRNVYSRHPLGAKVTAATLRGADYGTMLGIFRERFSDFNGFTFFISGDFDKSQMSDLLERYVASLPSAGRESRARDIGYRFTPGNHEMHFTAPMANPQAIVYAFMHRACDYSLDESLKAAAFGHIVKRRLLDSLREQRGWTYSVTGHGAVTAGMNGDDAPQFMMPVYVKVAPEYREATVAEIRGVIADLADNGPADQEVASFREYLLRSSADNAADNAYWLGVMKVYDRYGLDMHSGFKAAAEALTPGSIRDFGRRVVAGADMMVMTMRPEE